MSVPTAAVAPFPVVVADVVQRTPRVKSFVLRRPDGGELPPFEAGAHIDVHLPTGHVRSYSLAGDARRRDRYEIAVLREHAGGGGSTWMHDTLHAGDTLTIAPPANRFEIDEGGDEHILIAGGIGITPIKAIAHRLDELGLPFRLYYCAGSAADAAFAAELAEHFGARTLMHYNHGNPDGYLDVGALLRERAPGSHVYVCGPPGLIAAVRTAARDWPRGTVHFELFGAGARGNAAATDDQPFDVRLKRRGTTVHVPAGRSLLAALGDAGVRVTAVCSEGFCGTCTTRYIAGRVDHRDGVLDEEQRRSLLQVCVSRALPGETLVLDL